MPRWLIIQIRIFCAILISESIAMAMVAVPFLLVHFYVSDPNYHDMTPLEGIVAGIGMLGGMTYGMYLFDRLAYDWALVLPERPGGPGGPSRRWASLRNGCGKFLRRMRELIEWPRFDIGLAAT